MRLHMRYAYQQLLLPGWLTGSWNFRLCSSCLLKNNSVPIVLVQHKSPFCGLEYSAHLEVSLSQPSLGIVPPEPRHHRVPSASPSTISREPTIPIVSCRVLQSTPRGPVFISHTVNSYTLLWPASDLCSLTSPALYAIPWDHRVSSCSSSIILLKKLRHSKGWHIVPHSVINRCKYFI